MDGPEGVFISNELNKTIELDLVRKVLTENFLKKFS